MNSPKSITQKDACQLIWAYIQNYPLKISTLDRIKEIIIKNKFDLDSWDLSIIFWGFT